jgi:hypothetical protein
VSGFVRIRFPEIRCTHHQSFNCRTSGSPCTESPVMHITRPPDTTSRAGQRPTCTRKTQARVAHLVLRSPRGLSRKSPKVEISRETTILQGLAGQHRPFLQRCYFAGPRLIRGTGKAGHRTCLCTPRTTQPSSASPVLSRKSPKVEIFRETTILQGLAGQTSKLERWC